MKVFRMNDCDWYAGESFEDCKKEMIEQTGCNECDDPRELTQAEMETTKFHNEDDGATRSFREQLDIDIDNESKFPKLFASTEF